ncbi:MAG: hypothetical protein KC656_05510, partial [Myxococcales bacterium]|nr:hypothetical protein [Myxococcales bacterium]
YVDVLQRSKLPSDRKTVLIEKLQNDQEAALAAQEAVERHFGGSEEALVALQSVWTGLHAEGAAPPAEGSVTERAEAWIADLAGERAEAVQAFCREVHLILGFDEEEEEEEAAFAPTVEVD